MSKTGSNAPASAALGYLLNFLTDSSKLLGYLPPRDVQVQEILDEKGVSGHSATLPAPRNGFSAEQKEALENYAKTLTYWRNLLVELDWSAKEVVITFKRPDEEGETVEQPKKMGWREKLKGKPYLATRAAGQKLIEQGFMVREPVPVTMVTVDYSVNGYAIMLKYPGTGRDDHAGVLKAYDKWIPLLADIVSRAFELKSETVPDGMISTMFFTKDKRYVSSVYSNSKELRIFVPRRNRGIDPVFFTKATYRACRKLAQRYRKDFNISKKPLAAWGVTGHSLVMDYKKGAGGKIVDDSYIYNVRLMAEKLMKSYHILASIKHHVETRSLVVTFYTGSADKWMQLGRHTEGVAVIEHGAVEERAGTAV